MIRRVSGAKIGHLPCGGGLGALDPPIGPEFGAPLVAKSDTGTSDDFAWFF